ncbi:MAG: ABC transporter ATP-binding protein [Betaproteobacteria bacterium]|nr:ABC transporter ATP-binding protein [Betaproteobacteria bacterium]
MGELRVEGLSKHYPARRGSGHRTGLRVFDDITFTIGEGEFVSVIGASGCGKTTVLNLVAGLDTLSGGSIFVDGRAVTGPGLDRGVVFQEFALFPWLTVAGNIGFGLKSMGIPADERDQRIAHFVDLVGLKNFADYYPNRLSGGMRQRVGLGRALAVDPAVLLMDEPFGALDAQTRDAMQNALSEIWLKTRKTVLFITHDIREAIFLSDRVLVLAGRPSEVALDLKIELPRPRSRHDAKFQEYERTLELALNSSAKD